MNGEGEHISNDWLNVRHGELLKRHFGGED
jgi:hypothetical protein